MAERLSYVDGSNEPVSVAEAKLAARFDGDALDSLIGGYITAAREAAEHLTRRCYRPQVQREELRCWPEACAAIAVKSATACAVQYWDGADWANLAGAAYVFAPGGIGNNGTVLAPVTGTSWPTLGDRPVGPRVRIDLTAGLDDAEAVPAQVKLYIKAVVSAWVNNPDAVTTKRLEPSPLFECLLQAEKLYG